MNNLHKYIPKATHQVLHEGEEAAIEEFFKGYYLEETNPQSAGVKVLKQLGVAVEQLDGISHQ